MSYLALYRKYRPSKFDEVAGQKSAIKILKNAIKTENISHAYLFSGPRGTGKTSVAKIFAKAVNCLNPIDGEMCGECANCMAIKENDMDIIEIDAASNNGVDEIREIRNNVKLLPSVAKYKVYIIDEVHMLSAGAFNALLKTLEEPPKHVIFILATTEIQKIPLTIISRCQKFDFKKISNNDIKNKLSEILEKEQKKISDEVLSVIAEQSDGGLRDAINLLDQILTSSNKNITVDDIYDLNGELSLIELKQLFDTILEKNISEILKKISEYYESGKNIYSIIERLVLLTRDININNNVKNYFSNKKQAYLDDYLTLSNDTINYLSKKLLSLSNEIKKSDNQRLLLEITLLEIIENLCKEDQKDEENNVNNVNKNSNKKVENEINNEEEIISREIISVRVNNSLAEANKDLLELNKEKIKNVYDYLSSEKYNKVANIIKDSNLIVSSDKYLLFTFESESKVNLFISNIEKIEQFLEEVLQKKYKVTAVTEEKWNLIKKEYVQNIKKGIKYKLQAEPKIIKTKSKINDEFVEQIFGEENIDIK